MDQSNRYRQLADSLQSQSFNQPYTKAASFFFKTLQRLEIDMLLGEFQVTQQQRQIHMLEDRMHLIREEQREQECQNKKNNESSSEQVAKIYLCHHRNCGKSFQRESGVKLHNQLVHTTNMRWKQNQVFKIEIGPQQNQ